jgi:hypothetical protein
VWDPEVLDLGSLLYLCETINEPLRYVIKNVKLCGSDSSPLMKDVLMEFTLHLNRWI